MANTINLTKPDNIFINRIRYGGEDEIIHLYNEHKSGFIKWAKFKYKLEHDDALDIFQDAVIALYKNVKQGNILELNHSIKTYLYGIAKNMILNRLKYKSKFDDTFDEYDTIPYNSLSEEWEVNSDAKEFIKSALKNLGEPCYTLLRLYYYNEYSMEAIAREINSKNPNVVKTQKARCIKALRKLVEEKFDNKDFF